MDSGKGKGAQNRVDQTAPVTTRRFEAKPLWVAQPPRPCCGTVSSVAFSLQLESHPWHRIEQAPSAQIWSRRTEEEADHGSSGTEQSLPSRPGGREANKAWKRKMADVGDFSVPGFASPKGEMAGLDEARHVCKGTARQREERRHARPSEKHNLCSLPISKIFFSRSRGAPQAENG